MDSFLGDRMSLAALLGAGIVIGVSGLYLYLKVNRGMTKELSHLTRTIESLRKDISELKAAGVLTTTTAATTTKQRRQSSSTVTCDTISSSGRTAQCDEIEEYFDVSEEGDDDDCTENLQRSSPAASDSAFEEIDRLLDGGDADEQQMAYEKLEGQKEEAITNPEFVWRLTRACYFRFLAAGKAGDVELQKRLIFDGIKYSNLGLALDENHADIHKWYAVMLGRSTDFLGIQDKIKNGYLFKQHLDSAIKLRPDDSMLYFMKGRWCYEVSMLSWMERKVASTLFATPPSSSLEEAKQQFFEVERLKPGDWKENLLYIAKCFIGEGKNAEAVEWLEKAAAVIANSAEEKAIHEEVEKLLSKYKK